MAVQIGVVHNGINSPIATGTKELALLDDGPILKVCRRKQLCKTKRDLEAETTERNKSKKEKKEANEWQREEGSERGARSANKKKRNNNKRETIITR
jgi:hypothetical protein